ncbi:MAG TPA: preprotein translocase subunit SecE [Candidatus Woesebacteria bacterium]|nr:preprotein translocase subunit SecE [Candidatus Woesebacteria bacterium]
MEFIRKYLAQVASEIKKVSWPSKQQTVNKTTLVIIVSLVVATYIGLTDYLLQWLMRTLA